MTRRLALALVIGSTALVVSAHEPLVVTPVLSTEPLFSYEDAPATPDADDPAIWVNRRNPTRSLVSEGLVFDSVNDTLYVAFETIGLYKLPLNATMPTLVKVDVNRLIEPIKSFGQAYRAVPDDDEFECVYNAEGPPAAGDIDAPGSDANAGRFLQADLEGLSIIASVPGHTLMLASSQGDSSFHFYGIQSIKGIQSNKPRHLGSFLVDGVAGTDGVHYVPVPLTRHYPLGLLVVQNGEAPEPSNTGDINGYAFDGATQFKYVNFRETLKALRE